MFEKARHEMAHSWTNDIKKYTQLIRDMQQDIDAEEAQMGFHTDFEDNSADLATKVANAAMWQAEKKLEKFKELHLHLKPVDMLWADYISKLAKQKEHADLVRKRAALKMNWDYWGKPRFSFKAKNPNQKK